MKNQREREVREMKLTNWNEYDNAPAKTRFVLNRIEISEREVLHRVHQENRKLRRKMTVLVVAGTVISVGIAIICRKGRRER